MTNIPKAEAKQATLSDFIKLLWAPIAGLLGAVTIMTQFVQLWKGDQVTVTFIVSGLGAGLVIISLLWVGFSKRTYEVPDFIDIGKTKVKSDWRYSKPYRLFAYSGLIIYLAAGGIGGNALIQHRKGLKEKTVVLVANFDGPEERYGVTNEVLENLNAAVAGYDDIQIISLGKTITVEQGSNHARSVGERYLADVVIWGWYRPTENPNITVHIENIYPNSMDIIDASYRVRPPATLADLESFELQQKQGEEFGALVLFISGYTHYKSRDYETATIRFQEALDAKSWSDELVNQTDTLNYLAASLYYLDRADESIEALNRVIAIAPTDYQAYHNLGYVHSYLENYDQAINNYSQAIQLNPEYASTYNNRGYIYFKLGEYQKAIDDLNRSIELNPEFDLAYNNRGNAYVNLSEYELAIEDFTNAIQLNPDTPAYYVNRGDAYHLTEKYEPAIEDFTQAIQLNPEYARAYLDRADAFDAIGERDKAFEDYGKAIELAPEFVRAYVNRGYTFFDNGDYEKAIADYNRAIQINPSFTLAYNLRGNAYSAKGEYENAISDFTKAIELYPAYDWAFFNRGAAYEAIGQIDSAISDFQKCVELNGDTNLVSDAKEKLQQLAQP
jgi:tetratricopeptide (TPR) repeat protein